MLTIWDSKRPRDEKPTTEMERVPGCQLKTLSSPMSPEG